MKRNIVSDKFKIYYKMNQQNLRYNMLIPYILMIIISWIFCIGQFGINSYLYNNFYNTIDKRTIAVSISNENNADNLYNYDNIESIEEIGKFEDSKVYKVILKNYTDVENMINILNDENYEATKYETNQTADENEIGIYEFLAKILRIFHTIYLVIAIVLMIVFIIRECDLEKETLNFLEFLSFSKCQILYYTIFTCLRIFLYGIILSLILIFAGILLESEVLFFAIDCAVLSFPILMIYPFLLFGINESDINKDVTRKND